jgi:hypothetical protein
MNELRHRVLHGLAVLKAAPAAALARRLHLPEETVAAELMCAEAGGRAVRAGERWTLSPLARMALQADYSRVHAEIRNDPEVRQANTEFEEFNRALKALMTDWQVVTLAGERVPNDHQDQSYDAAIIDRLGSLHQRADPVLKRLEDRVPALAFYRPALLEALEKAEDGDIAWVSDVGRESYHTLWFELHEELIRILGGSRTD